MYQLFQSGWNVYKTVNMDYSFRAHIQGDYNNKKGEYKLIITGSSVEDVKFTFDSSRRHTYGINKKEKAGPAALASQVQRFPCINSTTYLTEKVNEYI